MTTYRKLYPLCRSVMELVEDFSYFRNNPSRNTFVAHATDDTRPALFYNLPRVSVCVDPNIIEFLQFYGNFIYSTKHIGNLLSIFVKQLFIL